MKHLPSLALASLLISAAPVWAQDVGNAPTGNGWLPWVVAGLLAVMVLMVSFMPSKRDHRD